VKKIWYVYPPTQNIELLYGIGSMLLDPRPDPPPVYSEFQLDRLYAAIPGCYGASAVSSAWRTKRSALAYVVLVYKATGLHCQIESEPVP